MYVCRCILFLKHVHGFHIETYPIASQVIETRLEALASWKDRYLDLGFAGLI